MNKSICARGHVVLIDDEPSSVSALQSWLEESGLTCTVIAKVPKLLDELKRAIREYGPIRVLLFDLMLPRKLGSTGPADMAGFDLIYDRLRTKEYLDLLGNDVAVGVYTAVTNPDAMGIAKDRGLIVFPKGTPLVRIEHWCASKCHK